MLVSCQSVVSALGAFFTFVFFLLLVIAGLVGGIWILIIEPDDFLWFALICFWVSVLSLSKLIGFVPIPMLIIFLIIQIIIIIVFFCLGIEGKAISLWVVTTSTIFSIIYILGFLDTYIVSIPLILNLPTVLQTLTITPAIIFIFTGIIVSIPSIIISDITTSDISSIAISKAKNELVKKGKKIDYNKKEFDKEYEKYKTKYETVINNIKFISRKGVLIFLLLLPLIGLLFSSVMGSGFWWIVLGLGVGFVLYLTIWGLIENYLTNKEIIRAETEIERERLEHEAYERSRPFEERLAEIENYAEKTFNENSIELREAKKELVHNIDKQYYEYITIGYDSFKSKLSDIFTGDYDAALGQVMYFEGILKGFSARYRVSAVKAKIENDMYTVNRKKAILFTELLKDFYNNLSKEQRKIEDKLSDLNIGNLNINIPDTFNSITKLSEKLNKDFKLSLINDLLSYSDFKKETGLSDGKSALIYLGVTGINALMTKYSHTKQIKEKLFRKERKIHKNIEKLEKGRIQAEAFTKRAKELNRAIEGSMNRFYEMFIKIHNDLFPSDNPAKSKEAREENKKNGGDYFTDEETIIIINLYKMGKEVMNIVDTDFEGEENG